VDIEPQPNYPFTFVQADALHFLREILSEERFLVPTRWADGQEEHGLADLGQFDAIHASPPCQAHSDLQKQSKIDYPDLIEPVRAFLHHTGLLYVIENVEGAPLEDPLTLCGTMFEGLRDGHRLDDVPCRGERGDPAGVHRAHRLLPARPHRSRAKGDRRVTLTGFNSRLALRARELRRSRWSLGKIATELGVDSEQVRDWMYPTPGTRARLSVPAPGPRSKNLKVGSPACTERSKRIAALWERGFLQREIAPKVGLSVGGLGTEIDRLRKAGWDLPRRPRGRRRAA
jgi:hypothetical protein